jgi:hypothetical protein
VPVLVQSGDLDTNTPVEQGRPAAAQFPHPVYGIVANAGHTPDVQPCGVAMAVAFIERLKTNPKRCLRVGRPPTVVGRPALHAAQLRAPRVRAAAPVRRAVRVALAMADERTVSTYSGMTGVLDALRGGTYVVAPTEVRFVAARVVSDATADGTWQLTGRGTPAQLRLRGRGVPPSLLTVRKVRRTTRITGTVGRRHVNVWITR